MPKDREANRIAVQIATVRVFSDNDTALMELAQKSRFSGAKDRQPARCHFSTGWQTG